jgi:hypothetical protein
MLHRRLKILNPTRKCSRSIGPFDRLPCLCAATAVMISKSGHNGYSSLLPRMDPLTDEIRVEIDREKPKALYSEAQKIAAEDLQYLPMWSGDAVSVHRKDWGFGVVAEWGFGFFGEAANTELIPKRADPVHVPAPASEADKTTKKTHPRKVSKVGLAVSENTVAQEPREVCCQELVLTA